MSNMLSESIKKMKPSPTLAVAEKAMKMKAQGIDIISLSTGEPDFSTPDNIKQAGIKAIETGMTKYTAVDGLPTLKKAIQNKFKVENNLDYDLNQITVGNGAKQIIFNALLASINQGEEVIIPAPYWVSYPEIVIFAGGNPVVTNCPMANSFKLFPEQLEKAITKKTKWLILNSPNNPTGAVYSEQELKDIADVLLKHPQVYVLCDDIYEHIIFNQQKFKTLAEVEPKLYHRVLTVNGFSKSYAMTGWRLGYAGGPKELIKAISTVQSQSTSNPCSISQAAGIEALNGPQDFLKKNAEIFKIRCDLILNLIANIQLLSCYKPGGAFYLFPNCSKLFGKKTSANKTLNSSIDVVEYFLEEASVALVPGSVFGMEGFFRISYATSENNIKSAMTRIHNACNKLK